MKLGTKKLLKAHAELLINPQHAELLTNLQLAEHLISPRHAEHRTNRKKNLPPAEAHAVPATKKRAEQPALRS